MNKSNQLVVFVLDEQRYALYLDAVKRIVRAVEVTPLPVAPDIVRGVINVRGQVIPVVNVRRRFDLPEREIDLNDRFIIAHTGRRTVALAVDAVSGIVEPDDKAVIPTEEIAPGIEQIDGVIKLDDGMVLIHDLDRFLSLEEEAMLDAAMAGSKKEKG